MESKVKVQSGGTPATSPCDFACDFCKLGGKTLTIQERRMHALSAARGYDISNYSYGDPSWLGIMSLMLPADYIAWRAFYTGMKKTNLEGKR